MCKESILELTRQVDRPCPGNGKVNLNAEGAMFSSASNLRSIVNETGAVILDISANRMVNLNATGGYVWDKLRQGKGIIEVAQELSRESHRDIDEVERDVREFVDQLISKRLLCNERPAEPDLLEGGR
jgi:hypothetical protein